MAMFRSIRWSLQIWHAAVLATILVAFGYVVFHLLSVKTYQRIDAELNREAERVAIALRPRYRDRESGRTESARGDTQRPPAFATERSRESQKTSPPQPAGGPKESRVSPVSAIAQGVASSTSEIAADPAVPPPGRRGGRFPFRMELNEDVLQLFEEDVDSPFYFVVWRGDNRTIYWRGEPQRVVQSKFAPASIPLPETHVERGQLPLNQIRQRGEYREVIHHRGRGPTILVGRSIRSDLLSLKESVLMLSAAGLAVLTAGLLGGWWFSGLAMRPIRSISHTAAEISASNLSRRIDVTGTETELTGLARTLNQTFDRLESSFAQQVRFTADASHELRTPLAVILSHSELALGKKRPPEELRETIETCRRAALRMKSLVASLLTLARFDSGEQQLECRPFDLSRVAGDCVAMIRPLADERRIAMHMDLPPTSLTGDPDRLGQVITNLLTNAIRYNHEHGQVVIAVHSMSEEIILSVSDTGVGIPPEHLPHIFERFYRVDVARARKDGGTGLGLAICKSIIEAHHGRIGVSSNGECGTVFEIRLPKNGVSGATELSPVAESLQTERAATIACG
jgi:heavy metal sensor kinase